MHNSENCHENVWILSGTSDGLVIVNKLLKLKYVVFASVVTYKASKSYPENPKLHIITGKLNDSSQIINFIQKNKINYVIDATHPFALVISRNLIEACKKIKKPLLTFERKSEIKPFKNFYYINGLKDIKQEDLVNKNILLAIGSRLLDETANYYLTRGANVFTRVIPTYESISKSFGSSIKNSNIAILEPSKRKGNLLEKKQINLKKAREFLENNIVSDGMRPKTECCIRALAQGVKAAHIIDGRIEHSLLLEIFTNSGIGTMINA